MRYLLLLLTFLLNTSIKAQDWIPCKQDGSWGFINPLGELTIPHQYDTVSNFHNNRAVVRSKNQILVIDSTGTVVYKKDYTTHQDFQYNFTTFYDRKTNSHGIVDLNGDELGRFRVADIIDDNWAKILFHDGGYGLVNLEKNEVIEMGFNRITPVIAQSKTAFITERDGLYGFVNSAGIVSYERTFDFVEHMSNEWPIAFRRNGSTTMGYINHDGVTSIPEIYDAGMPFEDGFAAVIKGGKVGYINTQNELVIPFEYDFGFGFSEGLALVGKDEKMGVININNQIVVPFKLRTPTTIPIQPLKFRNGILIIEQDNREKILNASGEELRLPFEYERNFSLNEYLFITSSNASSILVNTLTGFTSNNYDEIRNFNDDLVLITKDNLAGVMKIDGTVIIDPQWSDIQLVNPNLFFAEYYWDNGPYRYQFYFSNGQPVENCK